MSEPLGLELSKSSFSAEDSLLGALGFFGGGREGLGRFLSLLLFFFFNVSASNPDECENLLMEENIF